MAKTHSLLRQLLLIRKIQKDNKSGLYPSLNQLVDHVVKELSNRDIFDYGSSKLTFKRDIKEIKDHFGIPIDYDRNENGYSIDELQDGSPLLETALESFEILTSIGSDGGMPEYIIPEKRKSSGSEHFSFLLYSIKNNDIITFDYYKYDSETISNPVIMPYALKESQHRWYLIGKVEDDSSIRAYGLDRIFNLRATDKKFKKAIAINDIIEKYEHCFAMFSSDRTPERIVLSYDRRDGNYIKSFPIHHSQKIEKEEDNRLTFSFFLKIELDFVMEILSRSWSVEVVEPLSLRQKVHSIFIEAQSRNS